MTAADIESAPSPPYIPIAEARGTTAILIDAVLPVECAVDDELLSRLRVFRDRDDLVEIDFEMAPDLQKLS